MSEPRTRRGWRARGNRPTPPTARTITLAELEAHVPDATDIELPGPEGGWAVAVINGREYRARVGAVAVRECLGLAGCDGHSHDLTCNSAFYGAEL